MNPIATGTTVDNDFQEQVNEDLNSNSHEPATKGDVRNLSLRTELQIMKTETSLIERITFVSDRLDRRITEVSERLDQRITETAERLDRRITEVSERLDQRITQVSETLGNRITEVSDRLDRRITEVSERLDQRITEVSERLDQRITEVSETLGNRINETNERISSLEISLKDYIHKTGWKFFAATIGSMATMFTIFAMVITPSLK